MPSNLVKKLNAILSTGIGITLNLKDTKIWYRPMCEMNLKDISSPKLLMNY